MLSWAELKATLEYDFYNCPDQILLQKLFEWRKCGEITITRKKSYRWSLCETGLFNYIIDGFNHKSLQFQARMQDFHLLPSYWRWWITSANKHDDNCSNTNRTIPLSDVLLTNQQSPARLVESKFFNCCIIGHLLMEYRKPTWE